MKKAIPDIEEIEKIEKKKLRSSHKSEKEYFSKNKNVAGMATSDKKVILNPNLKDKNSRRSVYENEKARLHMKQSKDRPKYTTTDEQKKRFEKYGSKQDIRETIAARLHANDSSAGIPTKAQVKYAEKLGKEMRKK
jgi:hypothetical protein